MGKIILGNTIAGIVFLLTGFALGAVIYFQINKRGWETFSD